MEDVGPGVIWQHDGVLTPGPGAAGHAVHQVGDERAVEPEEDRSGDHVPVSAVEYDEAISVFTHLQGVLEKSIIPFKYLLSKNTEEPRMDLTSLYLITR